jgi:hypothetical protein
VQKYKNLVWNAHYCIYLFVILTTLISLSDYEKERELLISKGLWKFLKPYHKFIYLFIYIFPANFRPYIKGTTCLRLEIPGTRMIFRFS